MAFRATSIYTPHSTLYTPHFTLHTAQSTPHTVHSVHSVHSTLHTLHSTLYTSHSTVHSTLCTHTWQFTLHSLHSTLYTQRFTHVTPHSTLYIHTLHFTLHTTVYTLHSHFTLHTPHLTLYTLQSTSTFDSGSPLLRFTWFAFGCVGFSCFDLRAFFLLSLRALAMVWFRTYFRMTLPSTIELAHVSKLQIKQSLYSVTSCWSLCIFAHAHCAKQALVHKTGRNLCKRALI